MRRNPKFWLSDPKFCGELEYEFRSGFRARNGELKGSGVSGTEGDNSLFRGARAKLTSCSDLSPRRPYDEVFLSLSFENLCSCGHSSRRLCFTNSLSVLYYSRGCLSIHSKLNVVQAREGTNLHEARWETRRHILCTSNVSVKLTLATASSYAPALADVCWRRPPKRQRANIESRRA